MGCYSGACVSASKKVVGIISILLAILGIVFVVVGIMQSGAVDVPADVDNVLPSMGAAGLGGVNIVLGIVVIAIALLGIGTWKAQNPCCAIPFAFLTSIVGLVMLIIGMLILGVANAFAEEAVEQACNTAEGAKTSRLYNENISDNMCTNLCKCDPGANDETKNLWLGYEAEFYTKYGRTSADLTWADAAGTGYNNFYDCYINEIEPLQANNQKGQEIVDFFSNDFGDAIKVLEDTYECAGWCDVGLFAISRPISEGRAEEDCIRATADGLSSAATPVGVVGVLLGLAQLIAFCFSFALCCKSCIREEDKQIM